MKPLYIYENLLKTLFLIDWLHKIHKLRPFILCYFFLYEFLLSIDLYDTQVILKHQHLNLISVLLRSGKMFNLSLQWSYTY